MRSACATLAAVSLVDVVVIDCTLMGLSPPSGVVPTPTVQLFLRL